MSNKNQNSNILSDILSEITPEEQERTNKRMLLAARIDDVRRIKGWNKKAFAEIMGQQPSVITKWLSGTHNFTTDTLFELEEKLGINLIQVEKEGKTSEINLFFQLKGQEINEGIHNSGEDIQIYGDQFFISQTSMEC
ncbi:helix-turn-helix domain-containing protein [Marinilabilia salmonicolor]|uniref:helix-turn-helix domain-containing protein n=1 Tax=Marinilabilia salmonicolor TaxID=989 RepID=UPI00029A5C8D|nr:helix-turn-helix transcriptional regulator [Marinilabilia salmonicolor]